MNDTTTTSSPPESLEPTTPTPPGDQPSAIDQALHTFLRLRNFSVYWLETAGASTERTEGRRRRAARRARHRYEERCRPLGVIAVPVFHWAPLGRLDPSGRPVEPEMDLLAAPTDVVP